MHVTGYTRRQVSVCNWNALHKLFGNIVLEVKEYNGILSRRQVLWMVEDTSYYRYPGIDFRLQTRLSASIFLLNQGDVMPELRYDE